MSHIQIRIDDKTKKAAKKVFDEIGIDMSSGITVFLKQVIFHKGIPFRLMTENGFTPQEEKEILSAYADAKKGKNVTKEMSAKEAITYLKSL